MTAVRERKPLICEYGVECGQPATHEARLSNDGFARLVVCAKHAAWLTRPSEWTIRPLGEQ